MNGLQPIELQILIDNPGLLKTLLQGERDTKNSVSRIQKETNAIAELQKKAVQAASGYYSVAAVKNFVTELIKVRGEFQQINIAYETILKSKAKGDALFAETVKFAALTPFNLTEVAQGTKQLLAYGFTAKDITATLNTLGNVAAGVSAPIGDIIYLYGTLRTQGRAYARDIMQFTSRGIPIVAELAKVFGVTEAQVATLVETGKVGFPQVEQAFKNLSGEGGIFFNLMQKQSASLTGQISNLEDQFAQLLNKIGKDNEDLLAGGIAAAGDLLDNYDKILSTIGLLVGVYGSYKAAVIVTTAAQRLQAEMTLQQALAGTELSTVQALQAVGLRSLSAVQLAYNRAVASGLITTLAWTAAISALGIIVYAFTNATDAAEAAQQDLNDITAEGLKNTIKQREEVKSLERTMTDLNKAEGVRLSAAEKLRSIMGDRLKQYSDEKLLAGQAKKAIEEYTDSLIKNAKVAAAQERLVDLEGKMIDLDSRGADAIPNADRIKGGLVRFFTGNWKLQAEEDKAAIAEYREKLKAEKKTIEDIFRDDIDKQNADDPNEQDSAAVKRAKALAKELEKPVENFNSILGQAANKAEVESLKKALEEKLEALAPNDKQQSVIKSRLLQLQKVLDTYNPKAEGKAAQTEFADAQRRVDLLQRIYELNQKYNTASLSEDAQKLQQIRDEYDKLRADVDKYNANPKNTRKVNKATLQANEFSATQNQADLNENDYIAQDLERKKALYADYESYRERLGKEAADKEYANLLLSGKNLQDYLQVLAKSIPTGPLSGAMQARKEMIVKATQDEKTEEAKRAADLLASTITYEQQRTLIIEKYLKQAEDLRKIGADKQAAQALKNGEADLTALDSENFKKLDAFHALFDNLENLSDDAARRLIKKLRQAASAALALGNITPKAYQEIMKALNGADQTVNERLPNGLRAIAGQFGNMANQVGSFDQALGNAFSTTGNILNNVADIKSNFNQLSAIRSSGKSDVLGSLSSGLGILSAAIGIGTTIGSLFSNSKQRAKQEQYDRELQMKQIQAVNTLLERQLALTKDIYGPERLKAYQTDLDSIKAAQEDAFSKVYGMISLTEDKTLDDLIRKLNNGESYNKMVYPESVVKALRESNTLVGKSYKELLQLMNEGKLDEKTSALVQSLTDLEQKAKATANALKADITGTTFDSLNNDITALLDNGEATADNIGKAIEKSISSALTNSFRRNVVENAMQPFFDALYEAGLDGKYTDDELAALRAQKEAISANLQKQAEAYKLLSGDDSSDSAASKAIKGITSEQANALEGIARGTQLGVNKVADLTQKNNQTMSEQLAEQRKQTLIQMDIAANTKRTADNTDHMRDSLNSIDRNTKDSTWVILRNAGITKI